MAKHGCETCRDFGTEYDDWGEGVPTCNHPKMGHCQNLKSFPFKKKMHCHVVDFWHSEFADMIRGGDGDAELERQMDEAYRAYHAKYSAPAPKDTDDH